MIAARSLLVLLPLALAGCGSAAPSLSTGSLFGKADAAPAPAAPAAPAPATPEQRAAQVGAVSARAVKCGYNFDPLRLRASYLAAEGQTGIPGDQMARVEKAYDTINTQVAKAIASDGDFCTEAKTKEIKSDLTRHLAGDYSPPLKAAEKTQSAGWFGIPDAHCATCSKPLTPDRMWDKSGEIIQRRAGDGR